MPNYPEVTSPDPWLTEAMPQDQFLETGEQQLLTAVATAQDQFLTECRRVLTETTLTAAPRRFPRQRAHPAQRLDLLPTVRRWSQLLREHVLPVLKQWYLQAFGRWTNQVPQHWDTVQAEYEDSFGRDSWPHQVFQAIHSTLDDSRSHSDPLKLVTRRLGTLLRIDAPAQHLRDQVTEARRAGTEPPDTSADNLGEGDYAWRGDTRTHARWYTVGTANRATLDAGEQMANQSGEPMFKGWMCTHDERVRDSHFAADKQSVPIGTKFHVGGAELRYPGDPTGPVKEWINCRCTMTLLDEGEHEQSNRERALELPHRTDPDGNPLAPLVAADADDWSGGDCFESCMKADSPVSSCDCVCGGKNHGSKGSGSSGDSEPEQPQQDDLPEPPKISPAAEVLLGWKDASKEAKEQAAENIDSMFRKRFQPPGDITPAEDAALMAYTDSNSNKVINKALRDMQGSSEHDQQMLRNQKAGKTITGKTVTVGDAIDGLRSLMQRNSIPQDTTVYRGVPAGMLENLQAGDVMQDPAFLSASVNPQKATQFGDNVVAIRAPEGAHHASGLGGWFPNEDEVILPPGSRVRVTGVERNDDGTVFLKAALEPNQ